MCKTPVFAPGYDYSAIRALNAERRAARLGDSVPSPAAVDLHKAGQEFRRLLKLGPEITPADAWAAVAHFEQIEVMHSPHANRGLILHWPNRVVIVLEEGMDAWLEAHVLAHELGHFVHWLFYPEQVKRRPAGWSGAKQQLNENEVCADRFAAGLLGLD